MYLYVYVGVLIYKFTHILYIPKSHYFSHTNMNLRNFVVQQKGMPINAILLHYVLYYCAYIYQARSQGGFGGFDRTPHFGECILRSTVSTLYEHTGLAGDRVHLYTITSNVARLAAPRLHKRARRSERADVCNNNNNTHIAAIAPLPLTTHPR